MKTKRKIYPSDITKEQFERIRPILESARKKTKPRIVSLHEVFNGLLYVLKSGCQWRMLPPDYPNWKLVHYYFTLWSEKSDEGKSLLEKCLKKNGTRKSKQPGAILYNHLFDS